MASDKWFEWHENDLILHLHLQTRASQNEIAGLNQGRLKNRLTSAPVENQANQQLIRFLADAFATPRSQLQLVRGHRSRKKTIRIEQPRSRPRWFSELIQRDSQS